MTTHSAKTPFMTATRMEWLRSNPYLESKRAWTRNLRRVFRVTFCMVILYMQIKETKIEFCMRTLRQAQKTKRRWGLWQPTPRSTEDSSQSIFKKWGRNSMLLTQFRFARIKQPTSIKLLQRWRSRRPSTSPHQGLWCKNPKSSILSSFSLRLINLWSRTRRERNKLRKKRKKRLMVRNKIWSTNKISTRCSGLKLNRRKSYFNSWERRKEFMKEKITSTGPCLNQKKNFTFRTFRGSRGRGAARSPLCPRLGPVRSSIKITMR